MPGRKQGRSNAYESGTHSLVWKLGVNFYMMMSVILLNHNFLYMT